MRDVKALNTRKKEVIPTHEKKAEDFFTTLLPITLDEFERIK